jgi:histidine triad (HIT) family protein
VLSDCVFCRIVTGIEPASIAYRDETAIAFLDIRPATPGHLLVIPRQHAADLADLDPTTGGRLFQVAQRMAVALRRSSLRCEGVNLFLADGAAAGQRVFHVHVHVLPRFSGDGFGLRVSFGAPSRSELDRAADAVRDGLAQAALADDPDARSARPGLDNAPGT